jgi:hypothetical protein
MSMHITIAPTDQVTSLDGVPVRALMAAMCVFPVPMGSTARVEAAPRSNWSQMASWAAAW